MHFSHRRQERLEDLAFWALYWTVNVLAENMQQYPVPRFEVQKKTTNTETLYFASSPIYNVILLHFDHILMFLEKTRTVDVWHVCPNTGILKVLIFIKFCSKFNEITFTYKSLLLRISFVAELHLLIFKHSIREGSPLRAFWGHPMWGYKKQHMTHSCLW